MRKGHTGQTAQCNPNRHDWSDHSGKCVRCGEQCSHEGKGRNENDGPDKHGISHRVLTCGRCGAELLSVPEDSLSGLN